MVNHKKFDKVLRIASQKLVLPSYKHTRRVDGYLAIEKKWF